MKIFQYRALSNGLDYALFLILLASYIPAPSMAQVLFAPIDKRISTAIGKYGEEGDLVLLSLSIEECSTCSGYPLLASDLSTRYFGQPPKYLVPYDDEMFLTLVEDKFDIDLASPSEQLIVDKQLYSSIQTGPKSRILIVEGKQVKYFGLVQDFLADYPALLGKQLLSACNDTLKVNLSDKYNPFINQVITFNDSTIVFFNGYADELYAVDYRDDDHQYFELTDENYRRILEAFVDPSNFDSRENEKYLSKNRQDRLAISSSFASGGKVYAFGILVYYLLDGTEGYDRILLELDDKLAVQNHYRFPAEILEKEQKFYVNPYKGVYGNGAAVRGDTIYTKIYDPYLLEYDTLGEEDLIFNTALFLKPEGGSGEVRFLSFGRSQLPAVKIEKRRNYYSDWTHFFEHQGALFLLDESTLRVSNVLSGASIELANKESISLPQLVHDVASVANGQQIEVVYTINSGKDNAQTFLLTYDVEYDLSTLSTLPEYPNAHWKFVGDCLVAVSWEGKKEFTIYKKSIEAYK